MYIFSYSCNFYLGKFTIKTLLQRTKHLIYNLKISQELFKIKLRQSRETKWSLQHLPHIIIFIMVKFSLYCIKRIVLEKLHFISIPELQYMT